MPDRTTLRARYFAGADEQKPPSQYTQQRDADKDARQKILDAENKARHERVDAQAKAAFELHKLNTDVAMAANDWKLKEAELAAKQGVKLLAELAGLPSTDVTAENRQKFIALKLKYPMAWKNGAAEKEMESWDRVNAEAVKRASDARMELETNRKGIEAIEKYAKDNKLKIKSVSLTEKGALHPTFDETKAEKPEPKLTPAQIEAMRATLDRNLASYDAARSDIETQAPNRTSTDASVKSKAISAINKSKGDIAFANSQIKSVGERLKKADVKLAPEIDEAVTSHFQQHLNDEHGDAVSELESLNATGQLKVNDPKLVAARQRLNAIKKQIPGYDLIDPQSGGVAKGTATRAPSTVGGSPVGNTTPPKSIPSTTEATATPSPPTKAAAATPAVTTEPSPTSATLPPVEYGTGGTKAWRDSTPDKATHVSINYVAPDGKPKSLVMPAESFVKMRDSDASRHIPGVYDSEKNAFDTVDPAVYANRWESPDYSHVAVPDEKQWTYIPAAAYKIARETKAPGQEPPSAADERQ